MNAESITDDRMWSEGHPHYAAKVAVGCWAVSWMPGELFTRSQACTAMAAATVLADQGTDPQHLSRTTLVTLEHWAEELHLLVSEMLTLFEAATVR